MSTKEVVKKESTEIVKGVDVKSVMFDNNVGFEKTTAESFKIPIMKIVADLSPVYKKSKPEYNADAVLGDFYNSATGELLKNIDLRVLCVEHKLFVWKPERGGLVGVYDKLPEIERSLVAKKEGLKKWDKDGNSVVDTLQFTCCFADNISLDGVFFLPFAMTAFKYGTAWNSRLKHVKFNTKTFQPDKDGKGGASWVGVWNIQTAMERKGSDEWYTVGNTPKIVRGITEEEIESLGKLLTEIGSVEKDYSSMDDDHGSTTETVKETDQF